MRKRIALALGSGSARGLAHIGVLKVLNENQIPIHAIAGTSMGAFIGALYAAGLSVEQIEEIACNVDWRLTAKMFMPSLPRSGFVEGTRIKKFIRNIVGDLNIDDCIIPFASVAADIITGQEMVIQSGSLTEAVRASISIPMIFTPVKFQNHFLVDGGIVNPVPTNVAKKMGADIVIAVNVNPSMYQRNKSIGLKDEQKKQRKIFDVNSLKLNTSIARFVKKKRDNVVSEMKSDLDEWSQTFQNGKKATPGIFDTIMQTIFIMENEILQSRLNEWPPDLLIEPNVESISAFEFHKAKEIIQQGEEATQKAIPSIKKMLRSIWK